MVCGQSWFGGQDRPDLIICDSTVWTTYIASLQDGQRFSNTNSADAGFASVKFMDADVVLDGGIYNGNLGSARLLAPPSSSTAITSTTVRIPRGTWSR